jgi:hypothetical protein
MSERDGKGSLRQKNRFLLQLKTLIDIWLLLPNVYRPLTAAEQLRRSAWTIFGLNLFSRNVSSVLLPITGSRFDVRLKIQTISPSSLALIMPQATTTA